MGNPKRVYSPDLTNLHARIYANDYERLGVFAKAHDSSKTEVVRELVHAFLKTVPEEGLAEKGIRHAIDRFFDEGKITEDLIEAVKIPGWRMRQIAAGGHEETARLSPQESARFEAAYERGVAA